MGVVGIDLGTTNTVVGVVQNGQATTIRDPEGDYLIPSVVSFHPKGGVLVGKHAKERRVVDATNTVYSIKRLIGRSWNSEEVARARERFPFGMREGPGQAALVVARGETFTLPEISAFVLRHAKTTAEKALGEPVDRAVITVPASFNDLQRAATKVAGRVAGIEVLRILNEPTAAALAYGYGKGKGERIAIYDFGGGTFDVTLLDLSGNVFEVLATAGDTFLGGDDIDLAIAEEMAVACLAQHRIDARADTQIFERLRFYAERLKVDLSTMADATIDVPDVAHGTGKPIRLSFPMSRGAIEALAEPIVNETFEVCREALGIARLSPGDFDQIVMVGGSTRLPIVQRKVEEFFGKKPLDRINPDEVVAIGAAIQASALTGTERRRSVIPRPPMPAARSYQESAAAQVRKSEPPPHPRRHTDPLAGKKPGARPPGFEAAIHGRAAPAPEAAPPPLPKSPVAAQAEPGARRRLITGMGLGPARKPALPAGAGPALEAPTGRAQAGGSPGGGVLKGARPAAHPVKPPPKKGGTLGGVGEPALGAAGPSPKVEVKAPVVLAKAADETPTRVNRDVPEAEEPRIELSTPVEEEEGEETTRVGPAPEAVARARAAATKAAVEANLVASLESFELDEPGRMPDSELAELPPAPTEHRRGSGPAAPAASRAGPAGPAEREPAPARAHMRTMLGGSAAPEGPPPVPASALETPLAAPPKPLPLKPPPDLVPAPRHFAPVQEGAHRLTVEDAPVGRPPLPLLVDVTPLSLSVETVSGFRDVIIPRNSPVPCEQSRAFVTSQHGQTSVHVRVGQGESERFADDTLLGEVELSGLRSAARGEVHVVVTFALDTDGMLDVRASDSETGHAATARLRLVGLPDASEVQRMTARHLREQTR